jgi:uncharacterized protein
MDRAEASHEAMGWPAGLAQASLDESPVFTWVLVKLASRCNINCTYCYWFRDAEVYRKPPILTVEAEQAFCDRLSEPIDAFGLKFFTLVFHGGEPLLFPKRRFVAFQERLLEIERLTGCVISRAVCTNAILVDDEWADILKTYDVRVGVSLDGPAEINDRNRIDFKGLGTHAQTLEGIACLRANGIEPGLISVCNPSTDPERILSYAVEELGITEFDILPPDATHRDNPPAISDYYIRLFDLWYDRYAAQGVRIITLDAMIQGLLGSVSVADTIGLVRIDTVTLMPDGTLEPLDVLRIAGDGSTRTEISVFNNALQDIQHDARWREAFNASLNPCEICRNCEFLDSCGGGHLSTRWSAERRYDNPSVYCDSYKRIFDHIWTRISPTLTVEYQPVPAPAQPA